LRHYAIEDYRDEERKEEWAVHMFFNAINLRKLVLRVDQIQGWTERRTEKFMRKLFSCIVPTYSNLQDLTLYAMTISPQNLMNLLSRCKGSLRSLQLGHLCIPDTTGTWEATFTRMASELPVLETVKVEYLLSEMWTSTQRPEFVMGLLTWPELEKDRVIPGTDGQVLDLVYRKCNKKKIAPRVVGVHYRGPFVREGLMKLANTAECFTLPRSGNVRSLRDWDEYERGMNNSAVF